MRCLMSKPLIILVYPRIEHEKNYLYHWMPFSLLTIAKPILENNVAEVIIFDENQSSENEWNEFLLQYLDKSICVGISIMTGGGQIAHALNLIEQVKKIDNSKYIIAGGPHVNVLAEQTLNHKNIDIVLTGPGQNSFPVLIEAMLGKRKFNEVPGLIMKTKGEIRIYGPENPARPISLSRYPWNIINVPEYIRNDITIADKTLNYISSQGCVYKCQFCYELTYQRKYREINAQDLMQDIEFLMTKYGINGIKFYDADWFINLNRANEFSNSIINRHLKLNWAASINPNDVLRAKRLYPNLLSLLAKSGCSRLLMGIESGSNRVLNEIVKKEIKREQIIEVANEIANNGILGSYTFIIGFPSETSAEMDMTFDLINNLKNLNPKPETRVHLFAPYPGTPLYDLSVEYGFIPPQNLEAWSNYDYYESQTPWTNVNLAKKAREYTAMKNTK